MNNTLEQYKTKRANVEYGYDSGAFLVMAFEDGFDKAIALDLPVKFAEWKDKYTERQMGVYWKSRFFDSGLVYNKDYTNAELYQYWITNILKLE